MHATATAQTHLITSAAATLWHLLPEHEPATDTALAASLARSLGVDLDEPLKLSTADTLRFFDQTGLAEVVAL